MLRRLCLARPLWPAVTAAALLAVSAFAQAPPPADQPPAAPAAETAPESRTEPQPKTAPVVTAPDPVLDAQAEEAERLRRREAVGALYRDDEELARQAAKDERSLGSVAFQTFLALGIVILMVYLTLNYGLRKMMGLRPVTRSSVKLVDVVERVALDQKKSMYVVKVAGEYLLVGGAEGSLSLITKLDAEAVARLQAERPASPPAALTPFLQKLLSRRDGTPPKAG